MATAIIIIVIVLICVFGVKSYLKRIRSGCCGGQGDPPVKKIKVKDKEKSHYPYCKKMKIYGMTCGQCAFRVENALNCNEGVWAKVSLEQGEANILLKTNMENTKLADAVEKAGYTVLSIVNEN